MNIRIMMGGIISPLLLVLEMEMILRCSEGNSYEKTGSSMEAFMYDVTLVAESRSHIEQLLTCLQKLFKWAAMKIRP